MSPPRQKGRKAVAIRQEQQSRTLEADNVIPTKEIAGRVLVRLVPEDDNTDLKKEYTVSTTIPKDEEIGRVVKLLVEDVKISRGLSPEESSRVTYRPYAVTPRWVSNEGSKPFSPHNLPLDPKAMVLVAIRGLTPAPDDRPTFPGPSPMALKPRKRLRRSPPPDSRPHSPLRSTEDLESRMQRLKEELMESFSEKLAEEAETRAQAIASLMKANRTIGKTQRELKKSQKDLQKSQKDLQRSQQDLKKLQQGLQNSQQDLKKSHRELEKAEKAHLEETRSLKREIDELGRVALPIPARALLDKLRAKVTSHYFCTDSNVIPGEVDPAEIRLRSVQDRQDPSNPETKKLIGHLTRALHSKLGGQATFHMLESLATSLDGRLDENTLKLIFGLDGRRYPDGRSTREHLNGIAHEEDNIGALMYIFKIAPRHIRHGFMNVFEIEHGGNAIVVAQGYGINTS
ncbi:hypothetical protein BDN72DRAFT_883076 [Pluteus cervinus]|uniref:Uncharacterized protein n=1 Tax=Pluteus cervinus TaxID=181527 RepID=A0ACD3A7U4_9AGAR|nr:hypothetical protein BDN72DRAFT_883076 [Pluteus cervinus]